MSRISIVGIAYERELVPPRNQRRIEDADVVVGDKSFLGQIEDLVRRDAVAVDPTEDDEDFRGSRVIFALNSAREGNDVVLVSSGDPGIWGMAPYVLNRMCADGAEPDGAGRVHVDILPAPAAFQITAGKAGAPLQDGFVACSLCDDLTPEDTVDRRLDAAAGSGMATVVYKPRYNAEIMPKKYPRERFPHLHPAREQSDRRLADLFDVFLSARPATTPVVLARNLGEPDESVSVRTLTDLRSSVADIPFFAVLIICGEHTVEVGPYMSVDR